jgi:hypothetical protein
MFFLFIFYKIIHVSWFGKFTRIDSGYFFIFLLIFFLISFFNIWLIENRSDYF